MTKSSSTKCVFEVSFATRSKPRPRSMANQAGRSSTRLLTSAILRTPRGRSSRFAQEVDVVRPHEGEAEDGDVERGAGQRHLGHVACGDARVVRHQIKRVHRLAHARSDLRIAAAQVTYHEGSRLLVEPAHEDIDRPHRPVRGLAAEAGVVDLEEPGVLAEELHRVRRPSRVQLLVDLSEVCAGELRRHLALDCASARFLVDAAAGASRRALSRLVRTRLLLPLPLLPPLFLTQAAPHLSRAFCREPVIAFAFLRRRSLGRAGLAVARGPGLGLLLPGGNLGWRGCALRLEEAREHGKDGGCCSCGAGSGRPLAHTSQHGAISQT